MTVTAVPIIAGLGEESTTATISYHLPPEDGSVPYSLMYESDTLPHTNARIEQHRVKITDLRPLVAAGREDETSIEVTGFQVVAGSLGRTAMKEEDYLDERKIKGMYYKETEEMLKKVTGATKVIIFDHTLRRQTPAGAPAIKDSAETRQPVLWAHVDQTPQSGLTRVERHAGSDAARLLRGRAQIINVWRPLRGPVNDSPLAVADSRSLDQARDLMPSRLVYPEGIPEGETFQMRHSPAHRWYYLSSMGPSEALLLKCWENVEGGGTKTPHTAFVDDAYAGRKDVLPRHSIEVRAIVFHELEE